MGWKASLGRGRGQGKPHAKRACQATGFQLQNKHVAPVYRAGCAVKFRGWVAGKASLVRGDKEMCVGGPGRDTRKAGRASSFNDHRQL